MKAISLVSLEPEGNTKNTAIQVGLLLVIRVGVFNSDSTTQPVAVPDLDTDPSNACIILEVLGLEVGECNSGRAPTWCTDKLRITVRVSSIAYGQ